MLSNISILTLLAGLAAAQIHEPVGEPKGNPITRPLNEVVPACKTFTITWQPTTPNTVSILLLRGPPTNLNRVAPLAEGIPNSGTFTWTPSSDLEADTSRYGLQLIDDVTGQFQYSTQFGISKDACGYVVSSSSANGYPVSSPTPSKSASHSASASKSSSMVVSSKPANTTSVAPSKATTSSVILSTGAPVPSGSNTTVLQPSSPLSVPSSLVPSATDAPSATSSRLPESTGGAGSLQAGLGLVGAVAAMAFIL